MHCGTVSQSDCRGDCRVTCSQLGFVACTCWTQAWYMWPATLGDQCKLPSPRRLYERRCMLQLLHLIFSEQRWPWVTEATAVKLCERRAHPVSLCAVGEGSPSWTSPGYSAVAPGEGSPSRTSPVCSGRGESLLGVPCVQWERGVRPGCPLGTVLWHQRGESLLDIPCSAGQWWRFSCSGVCLQVSCSSLMEPCGRWGRSRFRHPDCELFDQLAETWDQKKSLEDGKTNKIKHFDWVFAT